MRSKVSKYICIATAAAVFLVQCAPRPVATSWKPGHVRPANYQRIMVVAILPQKDSLVRFKVEGDLTRKLKELGYQAVSASDEFGASGLANLGEEDTYLKLCNRGIDAVITAAMIRKTSESYLHIGKPYLQANSYYYSRIWNYKKLQEDTAVISPQTDFFWESILFDLASLEAAGTMRTHPFLKKDETKITRNLAGLIVWQMQKLKILSRQQKLRAF